MAINYSLSKRKNPQKKDEPAKYYAVAQGKESLDLDQFAEHITSHGCVYSKGDMSAYYQVYIELKIFQSEKFEIYLACEEEGSWGFRDFQFFS